MLSALEDIHFLNSCEYCDYRPDKTTVNLFFDHSQKAKRGLVWLGRDGEWCLRPFSPIRVHQSLSL